VVLGGARGCCEDKERKGKRLSRGLLVVLVVSGTGIGRVHSRGTRWARTGLGLTRKRRVNSGVDCWGMCVQVGVLIYSKTTTYRAETPAGRALILQIGPSRAPWARVGTCVCLTTAGAAASNVRGGAIRKGKCKRADWTEVARWGVCGRPQLVWACACVARVGRTRRRDVRPRAGRDAGRKEGDDGMK
jgi:hypothetical protein